MPERYSIAQISNETGLAPATLRRMVATGEIRSLPRTTSNDKIWIPEGEGRRVLAMYGSSGGDTDQDLAYRNMAHTIEQLPDSFERDRVSQYASTLGSQLKHIGDSIRNLDHPYQFWAAMLEDISQSIYSLRDGELLVDLLKRDDPLRLLRLLEHDLRRYVKDLRANVTNHDNATLTKDLILFRDRMKEWSEFDETWATLRTGGVACFNSRESEGKKYEELSEFEFAHPVVVQEGPDKPQLIWNAFGLSAFPWDISSLARWIGNVVDILPWQFDSVVSLSANAIQLSSFIGLHLGKNVIAMDNATYEFQPPNPPGRTYVVVDTACQTGTHLYQAELHATKSGKAVVGAIFLSLNDLMPEVTPNPRLGIIQDWKDKDKLIHCFYLSDLYYRLSSSQWVSLTSDREQVHGDA